MSDASDDPRFTIGLISDVFDVLRRHGYRQPEPNVDRATGASVLALLEMVRTFEGWA